MTDFAKIVIVDLKTGDIIKELPVMPKEIVMVELVVIAIIDSKKDFTSDSATIKIIEVKDEEFDEEKLNEYVDKRMEEFDLIDEDFETTRYISWHTKLRYS